MVKKSATTFWRRLQQTTQRARYLSYDISSALQTGENVIVLWLGTSWSIYAPYATDDKPRTPLVITQSDIYDKNDKKMNFQDPPTPDFQTT